MPKGLLVMLLAAGIFASTETTAQIRGRATVLDGDSLEIGGTSIRLFGIDAPELGQSCRRRGRPWACGAEATQRLASLAGRAVIACTPRDIDDFGRTVAICRRGAMDLGAEMVRSGYALAYRQYGRDYVAGEAQARSARRGLWAGEFMRPWQWRRTLGRGEPAETASTQSPTRPPVRSRTARAPTVPAHPSNPRCRIKGNIGRSGERIYHTPGSPAYAQTRIDAHRGERWFCTEAEARHAGWRAPRS